MLQLATLDDISIGQLVYLTVIRIVLYVPSNGYARGCFRKRVFPIIYNIIALS